MAQQQIDKVAMSAEKAALRLTRADLKKGLHFEYGGWIILSKEDGSLSCTKPVKGKEKLIDVDSIPIPDGFTKVAEYHTQPHTSKEEGEGADPGDIFNLQGEARFNHLFIPGYVADTVSGSVYRYTRSGPPEPTGPYDVRSFGVKIGTIPPD